MAPVNNVSIREGNKTANTTGAQNSGSLPEATARRAKRPAEEAREDLATGVEVLFGATSSAPSEELLAARAASKQPRDMAKKSAADAAVIIASAGQAGPSGARDMEHAPAAPSAPSAPSAPADASPLALTTAQVQALLAMLQQQEPVTAGTSNNDEVTASAKNNMKEENAVAPRPPKAARVEKNPAPAPAEEDSDESEDAAANMAPANSTLNRDNVTTSSPGNAGETSIPAGGNDRRGKRSSEEISPEGPSAVEVLLGGTPRAASEDTRAPAVQPRVTAEERVPGRQARALQKMMTAADAAAVLTAADAGQPGPTTQKRQRAAPSADVAQVNAPPL
ncbi:unnamed protein product [Closterium sp. NIES-53]